MNKQANNQQEAYQMYSIGQVQRGTDGVYLKVFDTYRPALKQLGQFSHVMVFWWADQFDTEEFRGVLQSNPPYAEDKLTGVFASRSPLRPNPIAMTTCKLLDVDEEAGIVRIGDIDAFDGTQIVDLKAYFPVCDRVEQAYIPDWLVGWPEWMPENGIGLEEGEA
ncbi:MAG: tRNA (N6-threonylcarbamoyladenosine(37)-N6)-methyltransferase TrmO [Anaerolineae bacterium]|nr:tRNA (N6-threonylcarbamoyladenosine(37)-N6)-methyltransferase TrmO [Anaerolineae bacterium]